MATLWERAQNLIDDHQDRQALSNSVTQKSQALYAARDALLATALEVHHNYRDELAGTSDPDAKKTIHFTRPMLRGSPASTTPSRFCGNRSLESLHTSTFKNTGKTPSVRPSNRPGDTPMSKPFQLQLASILEAWLTTVSRTEIYTAMKIRNSQFSVFSTDVTCPASFAAARLWFQVTLDPLSGYAWAFPFFVWFSTVSTPGRS
jgi:hypothetical protein